MAPQDHRVDHLNLRSNMDSNTPYTDLEKKAIDNASSHMPCEMNINNFRPQRRDRGSIFKKALASAGVVSLLLVAGASGKYLFQSSAPQFNVHLLPSPSPYDDLQQTHIFDSDPNTGWKAVAYKDGNCQNTFKPLTGSGPVKCQSLNWIPVYSATFDGQGDWYGCLYTDKTCSQGQQCFNETGCHSLDGVFSVSVSKR